MNHIQRHTIKAALSILVGFAAIGAQAQDTGIRYKAEGGKVYAYETSNPSAMYLIPNMTPDQAGLANGQTQPAPGSTPAGQDRGFPYNTNQNDYGFPYMRPPIPTPPAAANSALPALTFRDPVFSPQNLPRRSNPLDGLPRYPGKNYAPGNGWTNAAPWSQ